jgi:CRISPR-associated protein Csm1
MDTGSLIFALAGLLHDIGKVGQRSFEDNEGLSKATLGLADYLCPTGKGGRRTHLHVLYTNEFCDKIKEVLPKSINPSDLANLASYHHRPSDEGQRIITDADHLSSAMERETADQPLSGRNFRTIPLSPITDYISISGEISPSRAYAHQLRKFSADSIFPIGEKESKDLSDEYLDLWEGFISAVKSISTSGELKFTNALLSIAEKFLWSVPSATNVETPDISLFDHMKTTAAIAVCLKLCDEKDAPFVLAAGDFGGIQNYIFDIKAGSGGLAKALRGRSFEVNTVTDSTAMSVLQSLSLPLTNLIISAGGRFYLILPNTKDTRDVLIRHRDIIHKWILEEKQGALRFNLAWMEISKDDVLSFPQTIFRMNQLLAESGIRGLVSLQSGGKWEEEKWVTRGYSDKYEDICKSCYTNPVPSVDGRAANEELCDDCSEDRNIGRDFVRASFQVIGADSDLAFSTPFSKYRLTEKITPADHGADIVVDFRGDLQKKYDHPYFTILKNNYVPKDENGDVVEFGNIAEMSLGQSMLGILKADIDNLGYIFSRGLVTGGEEGKDRSSISRLTTLSRSLEYFFSGFIYDFLKEKYPYTYTVFSGGDDLLMIGPSDQIFSVARDLRREFSRYTCQNRSWGLSAGIAVVKPRTPILQAQVFAAKNLAESKSKAGKNAVTAFSTTMDWSEFDNALSQGDQLTEWMLDGTLNSSKVYRFYGYAQDLKQFRETGNTSLLRVIPQMVYDLTRNWGNRTENEKKAKAWAQPFTNPDNEDIRLLSFICQYALNRIR